MAAHPKRYANVCAADDLLTRIHLTARRERITAVAFRAAARRHTVADLAIGIHSTGSDARIDALAVTAGLGAAALVVVQAAAAVAVGQGIPLVSRGARAHWTSSDGLLATCSCSARVARTSLG